MPAQRNRQFRVQWPTLEQANQQLLDRLEELCETLFPEGEYVNHGKEFQVADLSGRRGDNMRVHVGSGTKRGVWRDWLSGVGGGGPITLIAAAACKGDNKRAWRYAMGFLGYDSEIQPDRPPPPSQEELQARRAAAEKEAQRMRGQALKIWYGAKQLEPGMPAHRYLAEARRIDLTKLHPTPRALRYDPECYHGPTKSRHPALVSLVVGWVEAETGGSIAQLGVHRTYLKRDGSWRAGLQDGDKLFFGTTQGGMIPLWRGMDGRAFYDLTPADTLAITEGIEDGLSVAMVQPNWRVASAMSVGNFGGLLLPKPETIGEIVVAAQNDPEFTDDGRPHPARKTIQNQVEQLAARGYAVRIVRPPAAFKDWNDLICGKKIAASEGA